MYMCKLLDPYHFQTYVGFFAAQFKFRIASLRFAGFALDVFFDLQHLHE